MFWHLSSWLCNGMPWNELGARMGLGSSARCNLQLHNTTTVCLLVAVFHGKHFTLLEAWSVFPHDCSPVCTIGFLLTQKKRTSTFTLSLMWDHCCSKTLVYMLVVAWHWYICLYISLVHNMWETIQIRGLLCNLCCTFKIPVDTFSGICWFAVYTWYDFSLIWHFTCMDHHGLTLGFHLSEWQHWTESCI